MKAPKHPRGRALRWLTTHRGITEQPPGSNTDDRRDGIRHAINTILPWLLGGCAWCGVWACMAARAGGVRIVEPWRWASVANIEDDAKARVNGFRGWTTDPRRVLRADLVVMFGRGVHVETVRRVIRPLGVVITEGGNTSSGDAGSQSNGGGSYRRVRRLSDVHGFALVDYPDH